MRSLSKAMVLAGVLALVCSTAQAQRQRPGGGFGGGFLLQNPSVQKELNLSDDQKDKVKEAATKIQEQRREAFSGFQDATPEERQKMMAKMHEATTKAVAGILDKKQLKRYNQIELQQSMERSPAAALSNPTVAKELNLSDDQKSKIKDITADNMKKIRELFADGGRPDRTKMQEIQKETKDKVMGVLTDTQKKTLKELQGEPFKIERQGRPGGGRGEGRPGNGGRRGGNRGTRPNNDSDKTEKKADKSDK